MLRIVVFEEATSVKLRLEGKLTKETTPSLNERWAEVRSRLNDRKAILDLGDVVEIDEAGTSHSRLACEIGSAAGLRSSKRALHCGGLSLRRSGSSAFRRQDLETLPPG